VVMPSWLMWACGCGMSLRSTSRWVPDQLQPADSLCLGTAACAYMLMACCLVTAAIAAAAAVHAEHGDDTSCAQCLVLLCLLRCVPRVRLM
jgi:hypothetical protein